jgi:L-threonylcarbamoyladenylate synthase
MHGYILSMGNRENPQTIAASIFDRLREFDNSGVDVIYAEDVDENDIGLAIMNRMRKAAGFNIINV